MLKKILALVAVAGFTAACVEEVVDASEIEALEQELTCASAAGVHPTKAALAKAMAAELGAWKPLVFLQRSSKDCNSMDGGQVTLSAAGEARCSSKGGCPLTRAILALQDSRINFENFDYSRPLVDQNVFNAWSFRCDLQNSFHRQGILLNELKNNYPSYLPPDNYTLTSTGAVSGMTGCGSFYGFSVSGTAVPANLEYELCFFGHDVVLPNGSRNDCGGNQWVAFSSSGNMTYIDPVNDGATAPVTTTLSCLSLTNQTVYDPTDKYLDKCCTYPLNGVAVRGTVAHTTNPSWNYCKR